MPNFFDGDARLAPKPKRWSKGEAREGERLPIDSVAFAFGGICREFWKSPCGRLMLVCGDCLKVLPLIKDDSVDCLMTDPPFGNNNQEGDLHEALNNLRGRESKPIENDGTESMRVVVGGMLKEAARILNPKQSSIYCFTGGGGPKGVPQAAHLTVRMSKQGLRFYHSIIWDKKNPGVGFKFRAQHEVIVASFREGGEFLWDGKSEAIPNILSYAPPRDRTHPNEKPLGLVCKLLDSGVPANGLVVDPFAGAATTLVAAWRLGMRAIGVEMDYDHFIKGRDRLIAEYNMPTLL
jgi:site-specific DNA-methyltransferase (adenine-specific)